MITLLNFDENIICITQSEILTILEAAFSSLRGNVTKCKSFQDVADKVQVEDNNDQLKNVSHAVVSLGVAPRIQQIRTNSK